MCSLLTLLVRIDMKDRIQMAIAELFQFKGYVDLFDGNEVVQKRLVPELMESFSNPKRYDDIWGERRSRNASLTTCRSCVFVLKLILANFKVHLRYDHTEAAHSARKQLLANH